MPDEGVVDGVDIACGAGAYRNEDVGLGGENLLSEQPGRLVGHVGLLQPDGLQAEFRAPGCGGRRVARAPAPPLRWDPRAALDVLRLSCGGRPRTPSSDCSHRPRRGVWPPYPLVARLTWRMRWAVVTRAPLRLGRGRSSAGRRSRIPRGARSSQRAPEIRPRSLC